MSNVRYIFSDMREGVILYEMPLRGVRMTKKLNDWGSLNGTFNLDMSGHQNVDLLGATIPGKCGLTVERDNVPIWDGIIWSRTYQSQAKVVQLAARTREAYLDKIVIKANFIRAAWEQRNIAIDLWNLLQSDADTNLRVTVPGYFSDVVLRDVEVIPSDFKSYLSVMNAVANGEDGFDWTIYTNKSGTNYIRTLQIGYPNLGSVQAGIVFEYPGNISDYYKTESITAGGTDIFVLGAGEGSVMPVGLYEHTDMLSSGWMQYDVVLSRKDLLNQAQVDDHAIRLANVRRAPFTTLKAFIMANADPVFGSYSLGDLVGVVLKDPRHPDGVTTQGRVVAFAYWPPSDEEVEKVELIFEGDELNDG